MTPREWLLRLEEQPALFIDMVAGMGLALAAWHVAAARIVCTGDAHVATIDTAIPTRIELHAAAKDVARKADLHGVVPTRGALASEAVAAGFPVIQ